MRRRVTTEPDLQKRSRILEEGLKQYPREASIVDELRFTRNKLALIDSIVEKARACEQSGQYDEAVEKWNSLLTVYKEYPGLTAEIERVRRAREKAISEAVERDAQEIERALQEGDPSRAAELLRHAHAEHTDAARLRDAGRRIQEIGEKRRRARELMVQAQTASDNGNHEECQTCLRLAFQMDESDATFRKLVLNKLIDHAQSAARTDWRQAEALIREATSLQQGYAAPGAVLQAIADHRRRAQERPPETTEEPTGDDTRNKIPEAGQALPLYRQDHLLTERRSQLDNLPRTLPAAAAELIMQVDSTRNSSARRRRPLLAVCVAAIFLSGILIVLFLRKPADTALTVNANAPGTSVSVSGKNCISPNCTLKLVPGNYTLKATADGYEAVTHHFTIAPGQAAFTLQLALRPLPQLLQVNTNFEDGQVYLDGRIEEKLKEGQYALSGLTPGRHTIRVTGGGASFHAEWINTVNASPEILRLDSGKDLEATMVANAGATGSIACNCDAGGLMVDGSTVAQSNVSSAAPTTLRGLKAGARQIALGGRSLVVDIRSNPALNIFLAQDRNVGMLIVETGEDGVKIFLNNRLHHRTTEHGMLRIPLSVGKYEVRVEKEGFLTPAPQTLAFAKGEEKPATFALRRALARLEIGGAMAAAKVNLDGHSLGETDRSGALQHEVTPGIHTIELSKDDYEPIRFSEDFRPGQAVRLDRSRLAMSRAAKAAAPIEPKQLEAQEWAQIVNKANPGDFDSFIRNHPGSAHLEQARIRAAELRQQAQGRAAQQAEQAGWDKADKNSREQLQDYLSRFPAGSHVQEARVKIDEIERRATEAIASQRLREQKDQEQAKHVADEHAIINVLKEFEAAYNRKDLPSLQRLWNDVPVARYRQQFREAKDLQFRLEVSGPLVMNGSLATVICTRTQSYRGQVEGLQTVSERVKLTLSREASGWLIRSIQLN
jgi:tetratricopeptide (TPR) repeat protein